MDFIEMRGCGNFIDFLEPMDVRGYDIKMSEHLWSYEFYSEGPKGKIRKTVQFRPFNLEERTCFNLFLGDWNEEEKMFEDITVTNNQDCTKVLITVAQAVVEFTNSFSDAIVYFKGNTPSRTRLYQIGIAKNWTEVCTMFAVFGYINNEWQSFRKNVNYEAFLIYRKINVTL
jgi:hypothetical protein